MPKVSSDIAHILRKVIVTRQEDYATSLAEDQTLLQNSIIGGRQRMAIEVRLGEKMILKEALEELERFNISSTPSIDHNLDIVSTKRRAEQDGMLQSKKRRGAKHSTLPGGKLDNISRTHIKVGIVSITSIEYQCRVNLVTPSVFHANPKQYSTIGRGYLS